LGFDSLIAGHVFLADWRRRSLDVGHFGDARKIFFSDENFGFEKITLRVQMNYGGN
jgi:hypothetical protein